MASYLSKLLGLLIFSGFVISLYYQVPFHNESATGMLAYGGTLFVLYAMYKAYSVLSNGTKVEFSPIGIAGYFLLHLFVLCVVFFNIAGGGSGGWFVLFFKILWYTALPILLTLISYSAGRALLTRIIASFASYGSSFRFLLSLGVGFFLFLTPLVIVGSLGYYNLWSVLTILSILTAISYREFVNACVSLWTHRFTFDNHRGDGSFLEQINLKLLSTEFLFLVLTFLVSVSFVNIIRPMPIGWDDLGAYMNYPQIMANNGVIVPGIGMSAWQTLTGIGFMFHSAPQAFFLNQIGGVLSIIVLGIAFWSLLSRRESTSQEIGPQDTLVNLPLLGATMFYSMPMVIFQQAKDMKLDPGLFFVSVIGVYAMISFLLHRQDATTSEQKNIRSLEIAGFLRAHTEEMVVLCIGIVVGLAFTIKFTSLMLIIGLIGLICFARLWLAGFLGFLGLFVGIFTKLGLWSKLNVTYPKDDTNLLLSVTLGALIVSGLCFAYAWKRFGGKKIRESAIIVLVLLTGILLPTAPWLTKNFIETRQASVDNILNGKPDNLVVDLTRIHTPEEIRAIEQANQTVAISSSGKAQNEDLGRYFGYEDGANNYLKLPRNLTMQSNQSGEYTEITYFYLALIPVIFLFLAYSNPLWIIGLIIAILFETAYFFLPGIGGGITSFFATQLLPQGYIWIALTAFLPVVYFAFALKKDDEKSRLFELNLAFLSIYAFIFVIAAYGIVWYGITMYFSFLLAILVGGWYIVRVRDRVDTPENLVRFFGSITFLGIIATYFILSAIPHGWNNLSAASFNEFKAGAINQEEAIFRSHPDYFKILATLNLMDPQKVADQTVSSVENELLKKIILANNGSDKSLWKLEQILRELSTTDLRSQGIDQDNALAVSSEARRLLNSLYNNVLYPPKDLQNHAGIYRIGTFLTYFISNNRQRYYDDSLVTNFGQYFYDENPNVAIERMKKLGLTYLLVDLNAATIDRDPRHDLTKRYERLISSFRSDKLELIQTDSICLQVALTEKTSPDYMTYAGVNFESYTRDTLGQETRINRGQKQIACYNHILDLIKEGKVTDKSYPFLLPIKSYIEQTKPKNEQELIGIFQSYVGHGWLALFRIK